LEFAYFVVIFLCNEIILVSQKRQQYSKTWISSQSMVNEQLTLFFPLPSISSIVVVCSDVVADIPVS
jgi:hypothetical protein